MILAKISLQQCDQSDLSRWSAHSWAANWVNEIAFQEDFLLKISFTAAEIFVCPHKTVCTNWNARKKKLVKFRQTKFLKYYLLNTWHIHINPTEINKEFMIKFSYDTFQATYFQHKYLVHRYLSRGLVEKISANEKRKFLNVKNW